MTLATGWIQDLHDPRDHVAERLLGAETPGIVEASMAGLVGPKLLQLSAPSCVPHFIARAIDMNLRWQYLLEGRMDTPPLASRQFVFANARKAAHVEAGHPELKLENIGCYPRLALKSVQKLGYPPESAFPYDVATVNAMPSPEAYREAFDQIDLQYARIYQLGDSKVAAVSNSLSQSMPVGFGMYVDTKFFDWHGPEPIGAIDTADKNGGGHMLCVYRVDLDGNVWFDNWWGESWGMTDPLYPELKGVGCISKKLFGEAIVGDVYVIKAAKKFSEEV